MIVIFRQTIQDAERQSQGVDAANVTANSEDVRSYRLRPALKKSLLQNLNFL